MNTKNNRRRRESIERIEKVFIELLQTKELHEITVSDICKRCELNRSTFYANFADIYELADKMREYLEGEVERLYEAEKRRSLTVMTICGCFAISGKTSCFTALISNSVTITNSNSNIMIFTRPSGTLTTGILNTMSNFSEADLMRLLKCGWQAGVRKHRKKWTRLSEVNIRGAVNAK